MTYLAFLLLAVAIGRISTEFDPKLQALAMKTFISLRFYLTQRAVSISVDIALAILALLCLLVG